MSFDYKHHVFRSAEFSSIVEQAIRFFQATPDHSLPLPTRFVGSGVYALYYIGSNPLYSPLARTNQKTMLCPIYIGKAVPPGWRTGRVLNSHTADLYRRLGEHARSIDQANDLQRADFRCRFILLGGNEGDLIVPIEAEMIRRYQPLWNTIVDGFGNHDPGSGRYDQAPSEWDILHPGRLWTERLLGVAPEREMIIRKIVDILEKSTFPNLNDGLV